MKLITSSEALRQEFLALMEKYDQWTWSVAWAGDVKFLQQFQERMVSGEKAIRFVVGLHFYQTDPQFIQRFLGDERVRYIMQPDGTFHPKMYLFSNKSDSNWAMLVGSGNFTAAAFSKNQEASVRITSEDQGGDAIFKNALSFIDEAWEKAKVLDKDALDSYKINRKKMQPKLLSLSGKECSVTKMTWNELLQYVQNESQDKKEQRMKVLKTVRGLFERGKPFREFSEDERKVVAGLRNKLEPASGHFGSMQGCGNFKKIIKENNQYLSDALDAIPLSGPVTQQDYEHFLSLFEKAFPDEKNYLAPATRLLAMKRPDYFVCLDGKNKKMKTIFGLLVSKTVLLEKYWTDIVERIIGSEWWQNPNPKNDEETVICNARAAFLDAISFEF